MNKVRRALIWLHQRIHMLLMPHGKLAFLRKLPPRARVLDVGCGNNSPRVFKTFRPDLVYTGLDVGDYNQQDSVAYADTYLVVPAAGFAQAIRSFTGQMDAVVSAHNLEHCDDPRAVLDAMVAALRPGGRLYLAFPCEESVGFPKRAGCLNFFDDYTHKQPPSWKQVIGTLKDNGVVMLCEHRRYRPLLLASLGLLLEPISWALRRNMPAGSTWALYGFESVLWAHSRGQRSGAAETRPSGVID